MHGDRPGGQVHVLPGPDPGVGAPAVDLHRAHRARHLVDLAGERRHRRADGVVGDRVHRLRVRLREHLTLGVVGGGGGAEHHRGQIGLAVQGEVAQQLGRPLDPQDEDAGGHRVERARVPDLAGTEQPPGLGDHVVRRHAARLVDDQQSGGWWGIACHAPHCNHRPPPRPDPPAGSVGATVPRVTIRFRIHYVCMSDSRQSWNDSPPPRSGQQAHGAADHDRGVRPRHAPCRASRHVGCRGARSGTGRAGGRAALTGTPAPRVRPRGRRRGGGRSGACAAAPGRPRRVPVPRTPPPGRAATTRPSARTRTRARRAWPAARSRSALR